MADSEQKHGRFRKIAGVLLRIGVSVGLMALILKRGNVDVRAIVDKLAHANGSLISLALCGFPLLLFLKSIRWQRLIAASGGEFGLWPSFRSYMAAYSLGVVTPGRLGELARAFYLVSTKTLPPVTAFRTVVSDRAYDLLFLLCFGLVGFLNMHTDFGPWFWIPQLVVLGAVAFLMVHLMGHSAAWFAGRLPVTRGLAWLVKDVASDLALPANVYNASITLAAYVVFFLMCHIMLRAVGVRLPFLWTCAVISCLSLMLLLPVSVAGFGVREVSLAYLLGLHGVSQETALAFSMAQFLGFFVFGGLLGALFLLATPVSLSSLRASRSQLTGQDGTQACR